MTHLRLGFSSYITLIGEGDKRLTDLAAILGISRQACNQTVKQVEAAGYIERTADPVDGRAKQLTLSPRGVKLRRDGLRIVAQLDKQFADIVGVACNYRYQPLAVEDIPESFPRAHAAGQCGHRTCGHGGITAQAGRLHPAATDGTDPRQGSSRTQAVLWPGTDTHWPSRRTHSANCSHHDVSKQAISVIATELEELGYLQRHADPLDARQIVLQFTARGETLIADSVTSVEELEQEFAAIIGKAALKRMNSTLQELYRGLRLEQDIFETQRHSGHQSAGPATSATTGRTRQPGIGQATAEPFRNHEVNDNEQRVAVLRVATLQHTGFTTGSGRASLPSP